MKTLLFKSLVLTLITSMSMNAQRKQIYSKVFDVNVQTKAIFNLDDSAVIIEPSDDDKVHLDYAIVFDRFSMMEIDSLISKMKIEATLQNNQISLKTNNVLKSHEYFTYNGTGSFYVDNLFKSKKGNKKDSIFHKLKDSIQREIREKYKEKPLDSLGSWFKVKEENGAIKSLKELGGVKVVKGQFVIKIPSFVKLTINAKTAYITFAGEIKNELSVSLKRGKLSAQQLINEYNQINIDDAGFEVEVIKNGEYTLNNISKGLIGSIYNAQITSEFSKIEIGEIAKGVSITDFNSEYWFYNWTPNFNRFNMYSEYSKINLFYPDSKKYSLSTFGFNTKHHFKNVIGEIGPNKKGEKSKMMIVGDEKTAKNKIKMDIIHGVIRFGKDVISIPRS